VEVSTFNVLFIPFHFDLIQYILSNGVTRSRFVHLFSFSRRHNRSLQHFHWIPRIRNHVSYINISSVHSWKSSTSMNFQISRSTLFL
jgi:hypothetical protein